VIDDSKPIEITCGNCGKKFLETFGWLKAQPSDTFRCPDPKCGAAVKYDRVEYLRLINEQAADSISRITLHPTEE